MKLLLNIILFIVLLCALVLGVYIYMYNKGELDDQLIDKYVEPKKTEQKLTPVNKNVSDYIKTENNNKKNISISDFIISQKKIFCEINVITKTKIKNYNIPVIKNKYVVVPYNLIESDNGVIFRYNKKNYEYNVIGYNPDLNIIIFKLNGVDIQYDYANNSKLNVSDKISVIGYKNFIPVYSETLVNKKIVEDFDYKFLYNFCLQNFKQELPVSAVYKDNRFTGILIDNIILTDKYLNNLIEFYESHKTVVSPVFKFETEVINNNIELNNDFKSLKKDDKIFSVNGFTVKQPEHVYNIITELLINKQDITLNNKLTANDFIELNPDLTQQIGFNVKNSVDPLKKKVFVAGNNSELNSRFNIKENDVLMKINGVPVKDKSDLIKMVYYNNFYFKSCEIITQDNFKIIIEK